MIGLLWWNGQIRGISRPEPIRIAQLSLLQVQMAPSGRWERHRVDRAARLLYRRGVRRILPLRDFAWKEVVQSRGITFVDPMPLYRVKAGELALALLKRRGIVPAQACVALRGDSADGALIKTALELCPQVRQLVFDDGAEGQRIERELYLRYGAAPCPVSQARVDVSVRFGGSGAEEELRLCGAQPALAGLHLTADIPPLPAELEFTSMLTALWQAGVLDCRDIRVEVLEKPLDI